MENALYDLAREHERIKHPEVAVRSAKEAADAALQQYEAPCVVLDLLNIHPAQVALDIDVCTLVWVLTT